MVSGITYFYVICQIRVIPSSRKIQNLTKLQGINAIKQKRKDIRKKNIFGSIQNTNGSFNDVTKMIEREVRNSPTIINDSIFRIKFSADGKFVSRKIKLINITFSIINRTKPRAFTSDSSFEPVSCFFFETVLSSRHSVIT
jgi:hypothetical protein